MEVPDLSHILARFLPLRPASIDCGVGWYKLIYDLDQKLAELDPDYQVAQIKEKFSGLRYYYDSAVGGTKGRTMEITVLRAEQMSRKVCEQTGLPGVLMHKDGWLKTLNAETFSAAGWTKV